MFLKVFDELQLATAFHFKAFQFGKGAIFIKYGISLLQQFIFFLAGRQYHCTIRTIQFEENTVLAVDLVLARLRVDQVMILVVCKSLVYHVVEHSTRVRHAKWLPVPTAERKIFRKCAWQHAPYTIRVELKRPSNTVDKFLRHLDNRRTRKTRNSSHLHRVPACSLAHHISIERVQNALVCELERVIQHNHLFRFQCVVESTSLVCLFKILLPLLQ